MSNCPQCGKRMVRRELHLVTRHGKYALFDLWCRCGMTVPVRDDPDDPAGISEVAWSDLQTQWEKANGDG